MTALLAAWASIACAEPWRFGLIADTQWPEIAYYDRLSGWRNPNGVAVDILRQVDREFAARGVALVVAAGDLTDGASLAGMDTRATWAQPLYNRGIGFFPLRGNHDGTAEAAAEFLRVFPQTRDGLMNRTPTSAFDWSDSATLHPELPKDTASFRVGSGFSSPSASLTGLSYAFRHDNATFVLLDQFVPADSSANGIAAQLPWIASTLASRPAGTHAFVLGHKGLITPFHPDGLFGDTPAADSASTNAFLRSLSGNGVRLYFGGHDHVQDRALIASSNDSAVRLQTVALGSDSYKFGTPYAVSHDITWNLPAFGRTLRTPLSQELGRIGFTVATIDGPRAIFETWSAPSGQVDGTITIVPDLSGQWSLRERYGYSLDGKAFLVSQGQRYAGIADSGQGTKARLLGGNNTCRGKEYAGISFAQHVTTGWSRSAGSASATFSLWGMECGKGDFATPRYAIALGLDTDAPIANALAGNLTLGRLEDSTWIRVAGNDSATRLPLVRPWQENDAIGTWGVDTATRSVWAVTDRGGDLAIRPAAGLFSPLLVRKQLSSPNLYGSLLQLPPQYANLPVTVELVSLDGRVLTRFTTRRATAPLPSLAARICLVRITAPGLPPAVLKLVRSRT